MFECTDCKKIYKEKPNYCDCGNNIFINCAEINNQKKSEKKEKIKKSFSEQYPQITNFINSLDILSVLIFMFCIVLSILSLIFIQPKENQQTIVNTQNTKKEVSMPTIENLWTDKKITTQSQIINNEQSKKKQTNITQKEKTKIIKTKKEEIKTPKETKVIVNNTKKENKESKQTQSLEQNKHQEVIQNTISQQEHKITNEKTQAKNAEHWNNYKVALRQTLFANLTITSIVGSGDCIIEFAIAKDGKLIQRAFSKQSPNETVNKAVYNMMMKVPYYYAPPNGYNGEKIKLHFEFNNGAYSISYIN